MPSDVLNRLYSSAGDAVLIQTLELTTVVKLVRGYDHFTARDGDKELRFEPCAMEISLPARNSEGVQDLTFTVSNINGEVSGRLRKLQSYPEYTWPTLIYRCWLSTDLTAPAERPLSLTLKRLVYTATTAKITASYMNILDSAWPRQRFTLFKYPGLRHCQ